MERLFRLINREKDALVGECSQFSVFYGILLLYIEVWYGMVLWKDLHAQGSAHVMSQYKLPL